MELGRHGDARRPADRAARRDAGRHRRPRERAELEDLLGQCERGAGPARRGREAGSSRRSSTTPTGSTPTTGWRGCAGPSCARTTAADATIAGHDRQESPIGPGPRPPMAVRPGVGAAGRRPRTSPGPSSWPPTIARSCSRRPWPASRSGTWPRCGPTSRRGIGSTPRTSTFALGLARLETQEGHLDRAEAVLRRAFEARPTRRAGLRAGRYADPPGEDRRQGRGRRADRHAPPRRAGRDPGPVPGGRGRCIQQQEVGRGDRRSSRRPGRSWRPPPTSPCGST